VLTPEKEEASSSDCWCRGVPEKEIEKRVGILLPEGTKREETRSCFFLGRRNMSACTGIKGGGDPKGKGKAVRLHGGGQISWGGERGSRKGFFDPPCRNTGKDGSEGGKKGEGKGGRAPFFYLKRGKKEKKNGPESHQNARCGKV